MAIATWHNECVSGRRGHGEGNGTMDLLVLTTSNELGTQEFPEANINAEASEARYLALVTERAVAIWGDRYRVEVAYGSSQAVSHVDTRDIWSDIVNDVFNECDWVVDNA